MGYGILKTYDVQACAKMCNSRAFDADGGLCQYFNIWQAVTKGAPKAYTCAMVRLIEYYSLRVLMRFNYYNQYWLPTNSSTATNTGQGNLTVAMSRGYRRISALLDGGFENLPCAFDFCFNATAPNWIGTSPANGLYDATIFHYKPYAHYGNGVGLLGSAYGLDPLLGTLAPSAPLKTKKGSVYVVQFFHNSAYSGQDLEQPAFVEILWNGNVVYTIRPGYSLWTYHSFTVVAQGKDLLAFHGVSFGDIFE